MKLHPIVLLHKFSAGLLLFLKPLGIWGLGGLAVLDSALVPIPGGLDGILTFYVQANPKLFLLYCLMGAFAAALGSLVPFYIGRAGGELFLLKRINRERYERLRDRFERQEFLALLIPSMLPPPTPWKMFVFGAGVFEMKTLNFMAAVFAGRLIRFSVLAFLTIKYGPEMVHVVGEVLHRHLVILLSVLGVIALGVVVAVIRAAMNKREPQESTI